jgi:Tfp pilus assembly protein PilF
MDKINSNDDFSFQPLDLQQEVVFKRIEHEINQNNFPAALKLLHQVIDDTDPNDPILFDVYKKMGNIYLKCGDIESAEEKYNLANALNSDDENLLVNYGVLSIQKGDYVQAKQRFADVISKNNQSDLAWVGLGLVHRAFADHELSRACLLRGLDVNPYNKLAITNFYQWCHEDYVDSSNHFINQFLTEYPNDFEMIKLQKGMNQ